MTQAPSICTGPATGPHNTLALAAVAAIAAVPKLRSDLDGLSRLAPGALRQLLYFGFGETFAFGQTAAKLHNIANCELAADKIMRPAERFVNYAAAPE